MTNSSGTASTARRAGRPAADAPWSPFVLYRLARIYLLAGEPDMALDLIESLLEIPYDLSPGWLVIDPTFDLLRTNPRFERLTH